MNDTNRPPTHRPSPSEPEHSTKTEDANIADNPDRAPLEPPSSIEIPEQVIGTTVESASYSQSMGGPYVPTEAMDSLYARNDPPQHNRDTSGSSFEDVDTSPLISESTASDTSQSTDNDDADAFDDFRVPPPITNPDSITASPQTIVQQIVHDTYLPQKNIEINVQTTVSVHRDVSPQPHEPLNIVTYADATNIAASYPELAATVLRTPLSKRTHPVQEPPQSPESTTQEPAPIHTADRPNWAHAPDVAQIQASVKPDATEKANALDNRKSGRSAKDSHRLSTLIPVTSRTYKPRKGRSQRDNHETAFPRQREPQFSQEQRFHSVKNSLDAWDVISGPASTGVGHSHAATEPSTTKPDGAERIYSGPEEDVEKWTFPSGDRDDDDHRGKDRRITLERRATAQSAPTSSLNVTGRIYLGDLLDVLPVHQREAATKGLLLIGSDCNSSKMSTTGNRPLAAPRSISWNGPLSENTGVGVGLPTDDSSGFAKLSVDLLQSSGLNHTHDTQNSFVPSSDPVTDYWQTVHDAWPVQGCTSNSLQHLQQESRTSLHLGTISNSWPSQPSQHSLDYQSRVHYEPESPEGQRTRSKGFQSAWSGSAKANKMQNSLRDLPPHLLSEFPGNTGNPKGKLEGSPRARDAQPNLGNGGRQARADRLRPFSGTARPQVTPPGGKWESSPNSDINLRQPSLILRGKSLLSPGMEEDFHSNPLKPQVFHDTSLPIGPVMMLGDTTSCTDTLPAAGDIKQCERRRKSQVAGIAAATERYLFPSRFGSDKILSDDGQEQPDRSGASASGVLMEKSRSSADNSATSAPLQSRYIYKASDIEGLSWITGQRANSGEQKTQFRARSSSPKYISSPSGRGSNFSPTAIRDRPRKYGLLNSGTPPPPTPYSREDPPFRSVGRRVNTPPPSDPKYERLSSDAITSVDSSMGATISSSHSRNNHSGKENRLQGAPLEFHEDVLYRV